LIFVQLSGLSCTVRDNISIDNLISTARSANVGIVLAHQTIEQLATQTSGERVQKVVIGNATAKIILQQGGEEAEFWSNFYGTKDAWKRTEQIEQDVALTEKMAKMGSLRKVEERKVNTNLLRALEKGQAVFSPNPASPVFINMGMLEIPEWESIQLELQERHAKGEGWNLEERTKGSKGGAEETNLARESKAKELEGRPGESESRIFFPPEKDPVSPGPTRQR